MFVNVNKGIAINPNNYTLDMDSEAIWKLRAVMFHTAQTPGLSEADQHFYNNVVRRITIATAENIPNIRFKDAFDARIALTASVYMEWMCDAFKHEKSVTLESFCEWYDNNGAFK